jgi:hypothetical protein
MAGTFKELSLNYPAGIDGYNEHLIFMFRCLVCGSVGVLSECKPDALQLKQDASCSVSSERRITLEILKLYKYNKYAAIAAAVTATTTNYYHYCCVSLKTDLSMASSNSRASKC